MKSSCIIVDDEPRAHVVLESYISRLPYLELKYKARNAIEAYEYLKTHSVDLILLDIQMPEVNGFSLLNMLQKPPVVIITTADINHAYKSYEYNAIDYLHKPIRFERFVQAIDKAIKWKDANATTAGPESIAVKIDGRMSRIALSDIRYIESMGNYVKIVSVQRSFMALMTTADIEKQLAGAAFVRIHKSFIVNRAHVKELANGAVVMDDLAPLPIGKTYKKYAEETLRGSE